MSKNIIDPIELFELLRNWNGTYCLKQNHGSITLVEMGISYKCDNFKSFQTLLDLLGKNFKYYKFLNVTFNSNLFQAKLAAAIRKENIDDFLRFKGILLDLEHQWGEVEVLN